jgi:trehalose 6-phosphate phosphatase
MTGDLTPFVARPQEAGVFLDFDGTLSDIVAVPSEARPVVGAADLLARLGARLGAVVVVSGRSAEQLVEWLGPAVEIWGVHGAQRTRDGRVVLSERAEPYREVMTRVRREAEEALAGEEVTVEDKAVVVTLHYRAADDAVAARGVATEAAETLAARYGLTLHEGRMALELRPPVELSKAAVVSERARAAHLEAVMFVGDDTVDLPAFDALDELSEQGVATLRVAVRSDESPPELLERADVVVDGPPGVLDFLSRLLPDSSGG